MDTSLQNTSLTEDEMAITAQAVQEAEHAEAEEAHIHLPNGSLWPIILGFSILITMVGLVFINTVYWISVIGAVLVFISIMGWALENPMATHGEEVKPGEYSATFEEAASTGKPTPLAAKVLWEAEDVVDQTVTVDTTAWSAHPVKVFVEREGVVLSLYGKVELEEQKQEVEAALRKMPGVLDVMNFLVAEDELLNAVNAHIERLKAAGKLEGAKNLSALVENYIVSLYGEVPDPQMKYMLENEITGIPGARVVINHIGLDKDVPGNMGKTTNRIARI
ncbi:MAG TPA: cytochrome c oxidase subunit 4 [Ktedonobacteraceae bacterium]|nr:cytochrome c oxidase subunit 4 [Ktedonobacteraceae bacterium]